MRYILLSLQIRPVAAAQNTPPQLLITTEDTTSNTPSNANTAPSNGATDAGPVSPSLQMIRELEQGDASNMHAHKRPVSPTYAALQRATGGESAEVAAITSGSHLKVVAEPTEAMRAVSPTLLAIQEMERQEKQQHSGSKDADAGSARGHDDDEVVRANQGSRPYRGHAKVVLGSPTVTATSPARFEEPEKDGEYHYHGYMDHSKQSRSFKMLQREVDDGKPL